MDAEIEKRGMRAKISDYLSSNYKSVTVHKVLRIIDGFKTIEEFCTATSSDWLRQYRGARPNSQFDLGKICTKAIEDVIAFVRDDQRQANLDRELAEKKEREAKEAAEAEKRRLEEEEERRNPKFSLAQMKAIVGFMELCEVQELDLKAFRAFLKSINVEMVKKACGSTLSAQYGK